MAKGMSKGKTTAQQQTEPSKLISETSQKAIADWKAKQSDESSRLVNDVAKANEQQLTYAENLDDNAMLTRAAQYGEKLGKNVDYVNDAAEIEHAKVIDDAKAITMLRHLETVLSSDELAMLPEVGSTRAEALAKRKEGDNRPIIYDKPKASGGRSRVETFYSQLVKHTPLGKVAAAKLEDLAKEKAHAEAHPDDPKVRDEYSRNVDIEYHNRTISNQLRALRTAAEVRVVLNDLKEHKNIVIEWLREDGAELADGSDATMVTAAPVAKVAKCLLMYNTKGYSSLAAAVKKARSYSLGTVKRWNVARALEIATKLEKPRSYITMDDLIASPKKAASPAPKPGGVTGATMTIEKSKRYDANNITEAQQAAEGFQRWYEANTPATQQANHATLVNLINNSDEGNATMFALWCILDPLYANDVARRNKAQTWIKAQAEQQVKK